MTTENGLRKIEEDDDVFTMDDFVSACLSGSFIDYDGFGHYATADMKTYKVIRPSDVIDQTHDTTYTHVVWYNR